MTHQAPVPAQAPHTGPWPQPYGHPQPYGNGYPLSAQSPGASGMSIAGMVLGIVSLVAPIRLLAVITALVGLPLAATGNGVDKRRGAKNGKAVAGVVCNVLTLAFAVLLILLLGFTDYTL